MQEDKLVIRRLQIIGVALCVAGLIVVGRLFYLQVIQHDHFQALADKNHLAKFEIPAARGEIYIADGNGVAPLVLNEVKYRLFGDPRFIQDAGRTADSLASVTKGDAQDYKARLERQGTAYVVLEQQLSYDMAESIRKLGLRGIGLKDVPTRAYPENTLAAQVIGFVDYQGQGIYGIEQSMEDILSGKDGTLSGAVDVRGIPIATVENVQNPPVDGLDVVLTIDRNLQSASESIVASVTKEYGGKSGSAIVLDLRDGSIRAMASYPSYKPAEYGKTKDVALFSNPIVSDSYEPGSIAKVFTMALGLDSGTVSPDTSYLDKSRYEVDGFTIRNSETRSIERRTMREVIKLSLNTGSIFLLEQLGGGDINTEGKDKLYDFLAKRLLLDDKTNIEQSGEAAGRVDPPQGVSDVRYANMTFGQGMQMTMVRMAAAYGALFNGGTYYQPRLVSRTIDQSGQSSEWPGKLPIQGVVKASTSRQLIDMMRSVVEDGAARVAKREGYMIGGKTGTAQKPDPDTGGYSSSKVVSSFVGFAGSNKPDYLILTRVDEPRRGGIPSGSVAIFAGISDWLIDYYTLPPGK